jgi:hypothetical protein
MNTKFPSFSSVEQTQKINELLGACESYYTVSDVFQYLPNEIEHHGKRGYLTVDTYSLSWTAYHAQQLIIAKTFSMPIGIDTNIFDVFILALEFVITNNLNNEKY